MALSSSNGLNTHNTQISKFLYGGRLDNLLKGHDKIVNGMEDPSFFAFTFGIDIKQTGLFALPESKKEEYIFNIETDRNYGVLTYLENAISSNTTMMQSSSNETIITNVDKNNTIEKDKTGNPKEPDTSNKQKQLTFSNEYVNMRKFINGFRDITINHPYMLQSVDGLQDAYKKYYNLHKDSYLGGNDSKIKIKCLESMDLRMSALFDSYLKAVYNHKYRRMNIPRNLLRFDCWLLVHDLRNIRMDGASLINAIGNTSVTKDIVDNLSTILFVFKNCIFDIEEIGTMFGTVNNAETTQTSFEFTFNYTDLDVHVNALADVLEAQSESEAENIYRGHYDNLDIHSLNNESDSLNIGNLDIHSLNNESDSLNIGNLVSSIGSGIFNYATMGNVMGNVYDRSWAGILSSLYSSISGAGVAGVLNSAIGLSTGIADSVLKEKIDERLFNTEDTNTTIVSKNRNRGNSPMDNIYDGNAGQNQNQSVFDNVYENNI